VHLERRDADHVTIVARGRRVRLWPEDVRPGCLVLCAIVGAAVADVVPEVLVHRHRHVLHLVPYPADAAGLPAHRHRVELEHTGDTRSA